MGMASNQTEKRRHPRVRVRTSALLFDRRRDGEWLSPRNPLGRFNVVNVSMGGALIDGDIRLPIGTPVGVHLELPGTQVQMASVVVRRDRSERRTSFALSFQVVPARDEEAVKRALMVALETPPARRGTRNSSTIQLLPRRPTDAEGHLATPSGAAWYTLRELETVHAQECQRCEQPFAGRPGESCGHGQDLRALLRALTIVLSDPDQYPHDLLDCRELALGWLGRDLEPKTWEVLRFRLDDSSAQALTGRTQERRSAVLAQIRA
jgi:hypothetical protein